MCLILRSSSACRKGSRGGDTFQPFNFSAKFRIDANWHKKQLCKIGGKFKFTIFEIYELSFSIGDRRLLLRLSPA